MGVVALTVPWPAHPRACWLDHWLHAAAVLLDAGKAHQDRGAIRKLRGRWRTVGVRYRAAARPGGSSDAGNCARRHCAIVCRSARAAPQLRPAPAHLHFIQLPAWRRQQPARSARLPPLLRLLRLLHLPRLLPPLRLPCLPQNLFQELGHAGGAVDLPAQRDGNRGRQWFSDETRCVAFAGSGTTCGSQRRAMVQRRRGMRGVRRERHHMRQPDPERA